MTDIEWGAEIAVNGKPSWLVDGDIVNPTWDDGSYRRGIKLGLVLCPDRLVSIRLPATHPYYLATSRGFTYWPGGESAPEDWDGGEVLLRDGRLYGKNLSWEWRDRGHWNISGDTIGYRKRTEQPAPAIAPELAERMVAHLRECSEVHGIRPRDATAQRLYDEMKAIAALLPPKPADPDLTLAKSIVGDAEAIALAIKAARENGRG